MIEKNNKILGTLLFVVLISCLIYLIFFTRKKTNKVEVNMIELSGNNLLSENDYLTSADLSDIAADKNLSLPEIKDRFDKHPYLENADVEYAGSGVVKVVLTEKKLMAIIINNGEPYFITNSFEILPMLSNTKFGDLPVISNAGTLNNFAPLSIQKSEDIVEAFKIIDAAKLTNTEISKKISEINLRNGGDIVLTLSGIRPPVIFGRGEEAKKMIYFEIMFEGMNNGNDLVDNSEYIDLRFANEIFLGKSQGTGLIE